METAAPSITTNSPRASSTLAARALVAAEWVLILLLYIRLIHWLSLPENIQQSDFRIYYGAASRLVQGLSPYGFEIRPGMFFVYPPWLALLVGPLTLLSFTWARVIWMAINLGLLVSSVLLAARLSHFTLGTRRAVLACLALTAWPPVMDGLALGQGSLLVTAAALAALLAAERQRMWLAGGLMVIAAIKPNLVFLLGLGLALRNWKGQRSIAVPGGFAIVTTSLLALCLVFSRAWVGDLIHSHPHTTDYWGVTVSLRTLFAVLFGRHTVLEAIYWSILIVGSVLALAYWTKPDASLARSGALISAATLLLTPYGQNHDYVLLMLSLILAASGISKTPALRQVILFALMVFALWAIGSFGSEGAWLTKVIEIPSVWNWLHRMIGEDALNSLYYNAQWNTRFVIMLLPAGILLIFARWDRYFTVSEIRA